MNTIFNLIESKASEWMRREIAKSQSTARGLIKHIEQEGKLRKPQKEAIEVYLWLKFAAGNKKISDIIKSGLLYDQDLAKTYDNFYTFGDNYTAQFLNQFFQDNGVKNLHKKLVNDPHGEKIDWEKVLEDLLHNYDYPNYLFSLPMGAGKTWLMAAFIYLDLHFAGLFENDKRFSRNFVVLAPQASKTAILPSLQTIKNFNPEWILPKNEAGKLKQVIQIEILDALGSRRRDKLQGNNPNLEKVNRIAQTKDFGMVFITNAEKVVLEKCNGDSRIYTDKKSVFYNAKIAAEILKLNELRERLSGIEYLGVILDEVHHSYGKNVSQDEKKLRKAVNVLNQHKNVVNVLGFSGTPYVSHKIDVGGETIRLNQIQDIVYNYYLNEGIGRFLKIPEIKKADVKESQFIFQALADFFADFDVEYKNGAKSKIAFYCPSVKSLNEKILPLVREWYAKNRKGKEAEIFKFYSAGGKENKIYELPKDSLAVFNNLDKPYADKRVILLVAVGAEGWDCKSLTGVVLPRQKTTKNFVLQTTCRCLREADDAAKEKALVYLEAENYKTLDAELKTNYNLRVSDLKFDRQSEIEVQIRKPKLGKLKYCQVKRKYQIISQAAPRSGLASFDFQKIKDKFAYEQTITKGKIGRAGLVCESEKKYGQTDTAGYEFADFIYDVANAAYGKFSESDLLHDHKKEMQAIFEKIAGERDWIGNNPNLELGDIIKQVAACLAEAIAYRVEDIAEDAEIELLEWRGEGEKMPIYNSSGALAKFMPKLDGATARVCAKYPSAAKDILEKEIAEIDTHNISFNYAPYKMDSAFEQNALLEMLKSSELAGLGSIITAIAIAACKVLRSKPPAAITLPIF